MEGSAIVKSQRSSQYKSREIMAYCDNPSLSQLIKKVDKVLRCHFSHSLCPNDSIELGLIATSNAELCISLVKSSFLMQVCTFGSYLRPLLDSLKERKFAGVAIRSGVSLISDNSFL